MKDEALTAEPAKTAAGQAVLYLLRRIRVDAVSIRSITHAIASLRRGRAVESAGPRGALVIWKGDNGRWYCESMRFRLTLDLQEFDHLAAAVQWLRTWLPRVKSPLPGRAQR